VNQLLTQFGVVVLVGALWGGALVGYLRLTTGQTEVSLTPLPELAVAEATPTGTPRLQTVATLTPTQASELSNLSATATATYTPVRSPTAARITPTFTPMPSPEPEPTVAALDASALPPAPTDTSPVPTNTSPPAEEAAAVSFAGDVLPIFERRCVKCHGGEKTEEGLILKAYPDVMVGSWNGPVIEPGSAEQSFLVKQIVSGEMPKKGPRLLPSEIRAIRAWIDAGALDN
jgi:mono/diheme cytochrome c family protein